MSDLSQKFAWQVGNGRTNAGETGCDPHPVDTTLPHIRAHCNIYLYIFSVVVYCSLKDVCVSFRTVVKIVSSNACRTTSTGMFAKTWVIGSKPTDCRITKRIMLPSSDVQITSLAIDGQDNLWVRFAGLSVQINVSLIIFNPCIDAVCFNSSIVEYTYMLQATLEH